jgi:hypothetical protein
MERATRETWARRVERWRGSGQTAKEFAAELGVRPKSLVWWRWRLGAAGKPALVRRPKSVPSKAMTVAPLTFIEMTASRSDPLEVVLPNGLRVHVGAGFDDSTLGRLLDVLEKRR